MNALEEGQEEAIGSGGNEGNEGGKAKSLKPPIVEPEPIEELNKVIYPQVCVTVCGAPEETGVTEELAQKVSALFLSIGVDNLIAYAPPLTAEDAIGIIGAEWEPKDTNVKFKDNYDIVDIYGRKIRFHRNIRNRPIYKSNIDDRCQDILNKRWELNGEPIIISDTGNTLDGQHTLPALILAQQRLETEKDVTGTLKWAEKWPSGIISIPKVIVYGIKGTDSVINTMNTCKPRSFADVLYRSPYFSDLPTHSKDGLDRKTAARVTDHAVKEIWQRTGLYQDGYSARRTNSEGAAWIESHGGMVGKFMECVRFILEEDQFGHISSYVPCGTAVALMWLSACGSSDSAKYYVLRNEDRDIEAYESLSWKNWKIAKQFWLEFGNREADRIVNAGKENERREPGKVTGDLKALTEVLVEMGASEEPMIREKDFVIAKAWNLWLEDKPITVGALRIKESDYGKPDEKTGVRKLDKKKHLQFGNIDIGIDRIPTERKVKEADAATQAKLNAEIEEMKRRTKEGLGDKKEDDESVTSDVLGNIKPKSQQDCEALHAAHPELQVILVKTYNGNCETWGQGSVVLAEILKVPPVTHPNNSLYLKLSVDDWDAISNRVTDRGFAIGLAESVNGRPEIIMTSKPSPRNGNGQRKR